jgi:hypothetical protein
MPLIEIARLDGPATVRGESVLLKASRQVSGMIWTAHA